MLTLSIIGDLRLNWPPTVKFFTSSLSVSGFLGVDFINPQCFLRAFGANAYALFTIGQLGAIFVILFGNSVVIWITLLFRAVLHAGGCIERDGREDMRLRFVVDKLEWGQTIVFAMQLTASWKMCTQLIFTFDLSGSTELDEIAISGLTCVAVLLTLEIFVVSKYVLMMHKLRTKGSFMRIGLTPERLERRMEYLTKLYDKDKDARHYWAFVIWARKFLLTCCTLMPDVVSAVQRRVSQSVELSTQDFREELLSQRRTVVAHASTACAMLVFFGIWHCRVQPFKWKFQNWIETALFIADVVAIGLGVVYTAISWVIDTDGLTAKLVEYAILVRA